VVPSCDFAALCLSGRPSEEQQRMNFRVENCSFLEVESEYLEYNRLKIVRTDGLLDIAAYHDRWWVKVGQLGM